MSCPACSPQEESRIDMKWIGITASVWLIVFGFEYAKEAFVGAFALLL